LSKKLLCVVYGLNSNGDILHIWTPQNFRLKLPPARIIGTNIRKWLLPEDVERVMAELRAVLTTRKPVCLRCRIRIRFMVKYHRCRIIPKTITAAIVFDITETALSA